MRIFPTYAFVLSTLVSISITACDDDEKPVDTATTETDTADTEDPVDTGETEDTSADTGDTTDTSVADTGGDDSADTSDTSIVDTGDTDTDVVDTGTTTTPGPNAVPDFLLADINPNSSTVGQNISPRDYLQQVSGWYFIKAT